MELRVVYTDGACSGNPGPGGWAWAIAPGGEPQGSGGEPSTTNQRMELLAVLSALRELGAQPGPIEVVSDSQYVVKCFNEAGWE
ncbi:MAG: RNase H family protein, partial [Actinomycetota bacterium]